MLNQQIAAVEKNRDLILDALDYIWKNPETGFKEVKTSKYLQDAFEALGYKLILADDVPGFYTVLDTGRPGPEILVLGEMDSLVCPEHPDADPDTGAVHCCGHAAQSAALLGIAAALKEPGMLDDLCGRIRLCAVPAEEFIELEYRHKLVEKGVIKYMSGKREFLHRGYFDGVDIAIMVHHTTCDTPFCNNGMIGCIAKKIIYKGRSAHAGGSPWNGCNALYAAELGLAAINAIRETFRDQDIIRVHPIITKGGSVVNAIPDEVIVESYVRGKTFDAIQKVNKRVNRALIGAALSLGANIDIQDTPGYAPMLIAPSMKELTRDALAEMLPEFAGGLPLYDEIDSGSTDMGDLSSIMPVAHPFMCGVAGISHGKDYCVDNPEHACVGSAKWQVGMITLLLQNNAQRAKDIQSNFKPAFASGNEFLNYIDTMKCDGNRIAYSDDKTEATVRL